MGYTAPTSKSTGTLITASVYNADIGDTRAYLYSSPAAEVYRSSNQTISNTTFTQISLDSESLDTDTLHASGTPTRLTASDAGMYLIWGQVRWAAVAGTSSRQLAILHSGGNYIEYTYCRVTNLVLDMNVSSLYYLAAAEYVTLEVWQNSGGNLNVLYNALFPPKFGMMWMGSGT